MQYTVKFALSQYQKEVYRSKLIWAGTQNLKENLCALLQQYLTQHKLLLTS